MQKEQDQQYKIKPRVNNITSLNNVLTFRLSNINVSLANAIRRTILSDISTVVFKTTPYEENKANITVNTSRINNEILKQRLSCIPIHIKDLTTPLKSIRMELAVENLTDTMRYVTTGDFIVKNIDTGNNLKEAVIREIFPANEITGHFIEVLRLRPKISEAIPGEKIQMTCDFSIGTAKEDSMFNVVSTCAYGYTEDPVRIEEELAKKIQQWADQGLSKDDIVHEAANWRLLDAQRITIKDSFDFTIQTVGVFSNEELVKKACDILIVKLQELDRVIDSDELKIIPSENTMSNCYDIILENEDYTIGKVIEFMLYSKFFENMEILSFCGFKKMHPHDSDSIIRVAYRDPIDKAIITQNLKGCISDAIYVFAHVSVLVKPSSA